MPAGVDEVELGRLGALGLSVPAEDLMLPVLTIHEGAVAHNLRVINQYAAEQDVFLCPHGKTMMAPQLLEEVLAGPRVVGLCAATVQQAAVMAACGAPTVFVVNQVVGRANIERLADLTRDNPATGFLLLVDSLAQIDLLLQHGAARLSPGAAFHVLIEVGLAGGRAGVRNAGEAQALLTGIAERCRAGAPIVLRGVSTYEGAVPPGDHWDARVAALMSLTAEVFAAAHAADMLTGPPIISAGGSATFDLAVNGLGHRDLPGRPQLWIRPGVVATYDHVVYQERLAQMDERGGFVLHGGRASALATFQPALALWAAVQSIPEPGLAIIAAGIRDFPNDAGNPTLLAQFRGGTAVATFKPGSHVVARANDQHAYLAFGGELDLRIGDVLKFGISHPCTAFDKWPVLFGIDDEARVTRAIRTYF